MSLSPRPERLRMTRSLDLNCGRRSMRPAMAWADSSAGIFKEFREKADGIGAAANAGVKMRGQTFFRGQNLLPRLAANDRLKITNHRGIGVGAQHRAEQVVRVAHVGDPVTHRFVDGVL